MNMGFIRRQGIRQAVIGLLVLVALSPAFAIGAEQVDYSEPLENAAEMTGATAEAITINTGVLPDYSVPGVDPLIGTLVAGAVGTALSLIAALGIGYALRLSAPMRS